jgi:hypothetical protein
MSRSRRISVERYSGTPPRRKRTGQSLNGQATLQRTAVMPRVVARPDLATPSDIKMLQRAYGNRATHRLLVGHTGTFSPIVQRELMSPMTFCTQSGISTKKEEKKKGKFWKILNGLRQYRIAKNKNNPTQQLAILQTLETDIIGWLNTVGKSKGAGRFFRSGAKQRHKDKMSTVNTLLSQIPQERQQVLGSNIVAIGEEKPEELNNFSGPLEEAILALLEAPLESENLDAFYNRLQAAYNLLNAKAMELLARKESNEHISEEEGRLVGRNWLRTYAIINSLVALFDQGKLKVSPTLHVENADPKKLYEYAFLSAEEYKGDKATAKEVQGAMDSRLNEKIETWRQTDETIDKDTWISTPRGKDFREAQTWLGDPLLKQLYDLYLDEKISDLDALTGYSDNLVLLSSALSNIKFNLTDKGIPGFSQGAQSRQAFYD